MIPACASPEAPVPDLPEATYVGRDSCVSCHPEESARWSGSHHDLAMATATEASVLGDFAGAIVRANGFNSEFFRKDDGYWVRTEGATGDIEEFEISYTFGVSPLQQYLVAFPGGRYQVLGLAWDTRPAAAGGQRWFDLYPDERIRAGDPLHWTGIYQNWNFMCAECHSTAVRKGYDASSRAYQTTYSEIDVSCEACHGPAGRHVSWANAVERGDPVPEMEWSGLTFALGTPTPLTWAMNAETGVAEPSSAPRAFRAEVETCARCHSRRSVLSEDYRHGRPLSDTHRVALLDEDLYFADGQIQAEVYVYGSFLQSKMYAAGVTCSNCHEPHSLAIAPPADGACAQCHLPSRFATAEHHFHEPGTPGASCVECHMPTRTYMVLDERRDHSFRIPRPDLTVSMGAPNACTACHSGQSADWAAATANQWWGAQRAPHYGETLQAARMGSPDAGDGLVRLALDWNQPGIARATALSLLDRTPAAQALETIERSLVNDDPLLRVAALSALDRAEPQVRWNLAYPMLRDRNRSVRLAAARVLASVPLDNVGVFERETVQAAVEELLEAIGLNADRPEFQLNRGLVLAHTGRAEEAEAAYRESIALAPWAIQARVNLADIYRAQGRDAEGEVLLREAVGLAPDNPAVHHALGLLLTRRGRRDEAAEELGQASDLEPGNSRFSLAYALALRSRGDVAGAEQILLRAYRNDPEVPEILSALSELNRDVGSMDAARRFANELLSLNPQDPGARALVDSLRDPAGS